LDIRVGDKFKDSKGAMLEVRSDSMLDRVEIAVAAESMVGKGVRRWHFD